MLVVFVFTVFESSLFPHSLFLEDYHNPAWTGTHQAFVAVESGTSFGIAELRTYAAYATVQSYTAQLSSFGNDIYRENIVRCGFGFPVRGALTAGLGITLFNYWVKDYTSTYGYGLNIGGLYTSTGLAMSAWLNNINEPRFSATDYVPLTYSLNMEYRPTRYVSLLFATRSVIKELPFFNFGLTYTPYSMITLGTGVNTEPLEFEYCVELALHMFGIRYMGSHHHVLGLSHFLGIALEL